jgi:hypothetical protein
MGIKIPPWMPAPSADLLPGLSIGSKQACINVEIHRAALGGGDVRDVHRAVF